LNLNSHLAKSPPNNPSMIERIQTQGLSRSIKPVCVVCAAELPPVRFAGQQIQPAPIDYYYPCCHTIACRMVVSRRSEMSEAGFRHYLRIEARQTQGRLLRAQLVREKSEAEAHENLVALGKLKRRLAPKSSQVQLLQLLVPSGPPRASKLAAQRREMYRYHLAKIIAEALLLEDLPDRAAGMPGLERKPSQNPLAAGEALSAPGPASELPGRLCAFCGGGCCTRGGDEAYLSAATMRRVWLTQQPELQSADDLIALYMDRLPSNSQAGSCINHGPQGCGLSREFRSDICNNYACESLAQLQTAQHKAHESTRPQLAPILVLVLRRKQDNWQRDKPGLDNAINAGALLRESGIERLTVSKSLGIRAAMRSADQAD
jgi:hypothetical protein